MKQKPFDTLQCPLRCLLPVVLMALLPFTAGAEIRLPQFFSSGMVLQQQTEVRLWGWADQLGEGTAGKNISVTTSWNNRTYKARTDADGRFEVSVQTPSAGGPYTITYSDGKPLRLDNILYGNKRIQSGGIKSLSKKYRQKYQLLDVYRPKDALNAENALKKLPVINREYLTKN